MLRNIYREKKLNASKATKHWLGLTLTILSISAYCQNLNSPNKIGPLGSQVNTLTGNLFITRNDIKIPGRVLDMDIRFFYNSYLFLKNDGFGNGWSFHYNIKYKNDTIAGRKSIVWGDGREDSYDSLSATDFKKPRGFFSTLKQYTPGKFQLIQTDSLVYLFDDSTHKRVTKIQEPNGNFLQFNYNTNKQLTSITNAAGQIITFTYNGTGRLASVVDAIANPSRTYTYRYDAAGNLLEAKNPAGATYTYTYLLNGPMKTMADRNANKIDIIYFPDFSAREIIGCNKRISFSYDTTKKKTVVTDHMEGGKNQVTTYNFATLDNIAWVKSMSGNCCGFNMSFEYDEQGNRIKETDANGNITLYTYDDNGNTVSVTDPLNRKTIYTYSPNYNKVTSVKDPRGNTTNLEYDNRGNLVKLTMPGNDIYEASYDNNGDILTSTDSRGNTFNYHYDAFGHPTNVTGPNGYSAQLVFDARGNLLSLTDARGNTHSVEYDILSRLKKITDPINNSTQFDYDANGNLVSQKNENNEAISYQFDASNRPVKVTGPTGSVIELTYDEMDNLLSLKNPLGHIIEFGYDTRNRVSRWKDALGHEVSYEYDANSNVTIARYPNGQTINFTYDKLDRLTSVSDGTGPIASYSYDAADNLIQYKNALGAETFAEYDSKNRVIKVTDPLGFTTNYTYDANDNIITVTDKNGFASNYTYDSLNRVKTFTDNNGFVTSATYDANGNTTALTDENGNTTVYTYDALDRVQRMTYPDGSFEEYSYDSRSNLVTERQTDGSTIQYTYDSLNRMVVKTLPGGEIYNYTYDRMGRVISASNQEGTVSMTYDAVNRLLTETSKGRTVRYNYDLPSRRQTIIYPDSTIIEKEFDTRNRLSRVFKDSILLAEYAYNNEDLLTTKRLGNGVETNLQYDLNNRLVSITTASGQIQQLSYTYDKLGNKKTVNRAGNPLLNESFTYDNGYRVTNYQRGTQQSNYTYDAVGNRLAANINGVSNVYTTNNLNQLSSKNGVNFSYDGRGNLVFDGQYFKTYDAEGRLIRDSANSASIINYSYDALGRRIYKSVNGNIYKYTYSGYAPIEELDSANQVLNQTVFANFLLPVMNEKNGARFFFHQNEMLSVDAISNRLGRLVESYRYDLYGKLQRYDSTNSPLASSIAGNRFGFTGQEWDSATNSYRFFYRNYSAENGYFNQRDLIEYEDGMGMYQYVGNNPANGIDVLGLNDCFKQRTDIGYKISLFSVPFGLKELRVVKMEADAVKMLLKANEEIPKPAFTGNSKIDKVNWSKYHKQVQANKALKAQAVSKFQSANKLAGGAKLLGNAAVVADLANKGEALISSLADGQSNEYWTQEIQAGGDLTISSILAATASRTPLGAVIGLGDFALESYTGKSATAHAAEWGEVYGANETEAGVDIEQDAINHAFSVSNEFGKRWLETQKRMRMRERKWLERVKCPEGGTRLRPRYVWDPIAGKIRLVWPIDPNEIVGPTGVDQKQFVSVKEQMKYTIRCENDSAATAPARYIRITSTPHANHDVSSFELGGFGLNNQNFEIPSGLSSYYQRLDCRDSMGLFVDVVAGYDQITNQFFWEFRGIDPLTLLPTDNPDKGILFLKDSNQILYGQGYVNFTIKPKQTAQTLDTTAAAAAIIFDDNEAIQTNVWVNTIDAFPPTSSPLADLPESTSGVTVPIQYGASDDANGVGFKSANLYIAVNNETPVLWVSDFTGSDTVFVGQKGNSYTFYASAFDRVNNQEVIRAIGTTTIRPGDCIGSDFVFTAGVFGVSYQWQVDEGAGFVNISNNTTYSGANTSSLVLRGATGSMAGYRFRALVNAQFTEPDTLRFVNYWTGSISDAWEDPGNWSCLNVPNEFTHVVIEGDKERYPIVNSNPTIKALQVNTGSSVTVRNGYTITVLR